MHADDISRYQPTLRERQSQLRKLFREWDPIGVYGPGSNCPPDEYDCLLGVVGQLRDGMSSDTLGAFLDEEQRNHFGVEPAADTHEFAEKVFEWYWADPLPGSASSPSSN